MRKILTIICMLAAAVLLPVAMLVSRELPADTRPYIGKKYAGWSGVLQAWVCSRWSPGGSFITWLNGCAADFERAHEGVYIEFTPVDEAALRAMNVSGIRKPDMVFFSPGVLENADGLLQLGSSDLVREEFRNFTIMRPVAMGGYIWVYNSSACAGIPADRSQLLPLEILPDGAGRNFSAALICLMSGESSGEEIKLPDPGIDLGLPVSADMQALQVSGNALDEFIGGRLKYIPVTQREIARLSRLRDSGLGPEWACFAAGSFAWADQLLLAGAVTRDDDAALQTHGLCLEFIESLTEGDAQKALAGIGAFSVTGTAQHSAHSPYAQLDALLASRPLAVPDPFSEQSCADSPAIVRACCAGELTASDALAKMGLKFSLQIHPN